MPSFLQILLLNKFYWKLTAGDAYLFSTITARILKKKEKTGQFFSGGLISDRSLSVSVLFS